ncbi:hypothetical protein GG851_26960 [Bordetella petrii]|nr:hypothetical protein [Bordetella petrii]
MNKTYRTVWCEATGTYVAVAENVKARGKRTSGARILARAALAVAVAGGAGAARADVTIADGANPGNWDGNEIAFSNGTGRIVFGQGGTVTGLNDAALDASSTDAATGRQVYTVDQKADSALSAVSDLDASAVKFNAARTAIDAQGAKIVNVQDGSVAAASKEAVTGGQLYTVDQKAQAVQTAVTDLNASAVKFNSGKTAIDVANAKITNLQNGSVAAGSKEAVTGGQLYVTNQDVSLINQHLQKLGLGSVSADYTGVKYFRVKSTKNDAVASGADAVAVGPEAGAAGTSSIAIGDGASAQVTATGAIAVGRQSVAAGAGAVVMGDGAKVESEFVEDALAMGTGAQVSGDYSSGAMAVGAGAQASAAGAVALGAGAAATGDAAIALGAAQAQGTHALALGNGAQANALNSIALGEQAGVNTLGTAGNDRTSHIAIGTRAGQSVVGNQTIALGFEAGSGVEGDQNIAIGSQAGSGVDGDLNVAIGYQANRNADQVDHATAVGSNTYAGRDAVAMGYMAQAHSEGSVALGVQARVTNGQGVAIGKNAMSDGAGVALGSNSAALASDASGTGYLTGSSFLGGSVVSVGNTSTGGTRRIVNVADGSAIHDAVNVGQLHGAQDAVAKLVGGDVTVGADGKFSKVTLVDTTGTEHEYNTVVDALGAVTSGGISVLPPEAAKYNTDGTLNVATATHGGEAVNLDQLNESIDANAARYYSVNSALPGNRDNSNATGSNAMAIGPEASAIGDASTAVGYQAFAQSDQALALGHNTNALGANSTVVGNNSFAYGKSGVAMGDEARSQGDNSIVIGTKAQADPKDPNQTVHNSVVIGTEAESTADNGIAVGQSALASDVRGIAQGYDAEASARDATAIGSQAHASGVSATASGTRALASGANAIASGTDAKAYADSGIAMGQGAQAGKANLRPDEQANNVDAVAIGTGALADAKNASALGRTAQATAEQALAVGDGTTVSGRQGSALGAGNNVTAEQGLALGAANAINGTGSSATGNGNTVNGTNAQTVGNDNLVAAGNGGVFGNSNTLSSGATGSRIIGNNNSVGAPDAFVMGNNSTVTMAGGVALGSGSASTTGANVAGYTPNSNAGTANNAIAATVSTTGAVAVGGNGLRRQITGVAAGTADSDAVNVAQLKATGWNVRTDGDAATHVSTGQGNTVDIGLANGENNMTVTRTSANGTTVIDYALKKNLDLGATGSVKTGDTLVNNTGVAVGPNVALGNTGLVIANGPSVTSGGISAGGKTITNVAPGVNGTDAVNVDQLTSKEQEVVNKGFGLKAGDGQTVQKKLGEAVEVVGADANVVTKVANGQVQVALGDSISVTNNLNVGGDTTLGGTLNVAGNTNLTGGASISNHLTVNPNTNVNMGGNQVHNVAAGTSVTDAVNLGQLNDLAARPLTFTADSGADLDRKLGEKVGINGADGNITTQTTPTGVQIALAKNLDLGAAGSVKMGDTSVSGNGVVINNGPSMTSGGISAGSKTITNVAAGVNGTDAVNVDQLTSKEQELITKGFGLKAADGNEARKPLGETVEVIGANSNVTTSVDQGKVLIKLSDDLNVSNVAVTNNLSVGGTTNLGNDTLVVKQGSVTVGGNTTVNMGGNKVTNVAKGEAGTDAVNVDQLNELADKPLTFTADSGTDLDRKLGETVGINGADSNITTETTPTGVQIALAKNLDLGATGSVKTGDTLVNNAGVAVGPNVALGNTGLVIANGPSVTSGGISAGGKTITNVAPGVNGTDGVNVDQLKGVEDVANAGWNLTAEGGNLSNVAPGGKVDLASSDGNIVITKGATDADVKFALADQVNVSNVAVTNNLSVGGTTNLGNDTLVVKQGSVTVGGNTTVNMGGNKVTNVAKGEAGTDAVNVDQLNELADKPLTFTADSGAGLDRKLGETVGINGADSNITTQTTATGVQIALAKNLDLGATGSVKTGDTLVNNAGVAVGPNVALGNTGLVIANGPSVTSGGISAGGKTITNVAPGVNGTDAVNVDQLTSKEQEVVNKGFGLKAGDGQTVQKKLGEAVEVVGADANVVTKVANGQVQVALGDSISVTNNLNVGGDTTLGGTLNVAGNTNLTGGASISNHLTVNPNTNVDMGGNQVHNVAAGTSVTDAVNLGQLNDLAARPLTFTADSGADLDRKLGEKVGINGADGNITTQTTPTGVQIALAKNLDLGATGSVKTGDTLVSNAGVAVGPNVALGNTGLVIANGPSVTTGGISAGGKVITNVAPGVNGTDGVNVDQLKGVEDVANAGWNLTAEGGNLSNVAPGGKVDLASSDGNIVITKGATDADVKFALADQVNVSNVAVTNNLSVGGTTNLGNDTLVVKQGSVTVGGNTTVNMGGNKVTNIAKGEAGTDAVNVDQLTELANKPLTFTADSGNALERKLGEAVAFNGADANITTETTAGGVRIALAKNLDLGTDGSIKLGDTMLSGNGMAIIGGPSVTKAGINAGGKSIINVAAGVNDTDAVNVGQLKDVETVARTGWQLSVNGNAAADQTQVKPGDVVDFSNDDGNVVIAKNGNDVKVNLNRDLDVDSVTAGDTVLNKDGVQVGDDVKLTAAGLGVGSNVFVGSDGLRAGNVVISASTGINAGGFKITNVAAGTDDTDAVNVSQLKDVQQNVDNLDDRAVKYDGNKGDPKNSITLEGDKSTDGGKTGGTKITNLAQGEISATSTDAVNGAQLHEQGTQVADALGGNSKYVDGKLVTELNVGDKSYNNVNDALNGVNNDLTNKIDNVEQTANAGWQIEANGDGASKVAPGSKVEFVNGDNVQITRETSADGNNTVKVSVSQDIQVNSVTAKEIKANTVKAKEVAIENGPTINQNGIDMGNKRIVNLGAGTAPTDAVNLGQLEAATSGLQNQVNQVRGDLSRLNNKLSAGVASAMATAGLPQAYMPGKSMAAMAGGTYNGESGFAIGVSTVSDNGSWVLKLSGNTNSRGDYGGAVGVGYQW